LINAPAKTAVSSVIPAPAALKGDLGSREEQACYLVDIFLLLELSEKGGVFD
jgi:hypothetical protein